MSVPAVLSRKLAPDKENQMDGSSVELEITDGTAALPAVFEEL